jgi:hypothetical protein
MVAGQREVGPRLRRPFGGVARRGIGEMPDRDPRAHAGPIALIEMYERVGRRVAGDRRVDSEDRRGELRRAEALAFQRKESKFIRGIEQPQLARDSRQSMICGRFSRQICSGRRSPWASSRGRSLEGAKHPRSVVCFKSMHTSVYWG